MIRRRISITRLAEIFLFGACPQDGPQLRLSCIVATRPCSC